MIKNKKGVTTLELLAYIIISALVIASIFTLVISSVSHSNRTSLSSDVINEGSRHLDYIQNETVDKNYSKVEYCNNDVLCLVFTKDSITTVISIKTLENRNLLYINDELVTPDDFNLTDISFNLDYSNLVLIKFTITKYDYSKVFYTSIKI